MENKWVHTVGFRCNGCGNFKPKAQRSASGDCLGCAAALDDAILVHLYGDDVQTWTCHDCQSTFVLRAGLSLINGDAVCPWCDQNINSPEAL